jgi:carbonic anhydrase
MTRPLRAGRGRWGGSMQPIGSQKVVGEPAPAILVNSTLALIPVIFGLFADDFLGAGGGRTSSFVFCAFLGWSLLLCYVWRYFPSKAFKSMILFVTIPVQWGGVAAVVGSVQLGGTFAEMDGNAIGLLGLFTIFAALTFVITKSSLHHSGKAAGFVGVGLVAMGAMFWHGLAGWSISGHTSLSSARTPVSILIENAQTPAEGGVGPHSRRTEQMSTGRAQLIWTYKGETGPLMWGALADENKACSSGHAQSPVDIPKRSALMRNDMRLDWLQEQGAGERSARTIQVKFPGKSHAVIAGQAYTLREFNIHSPSEHQVSGFSYPLEVQFVHESASGKIAIVAAFIEIGTANPEFAKIIASTTGTLNAAPVETPMINLLALVPDNTASYRYHGSLTKPPCTEGVLWSVIEKPIEISQEQVTAIRRALSSNARPVQSMGGRIFESINPEIAH